MHQLAAKYVMDWVASTNSDTSWGDMAASKGSRCVVHTLSRENPEFFKDMIKLELDNRVKSSIEEKVLGFHIYQLSLLSSQILADLREVHSAHQKSDLGANLTKILIYLDQNMAFEDLKREFRKQGGILSEAIYLFVGEMSHHSCVEHLSRVDEKQSLLIVVSDHTLEACAHSIPFQYIYVPIHEKVLTIGGSGCVPTWCTQTLSRNAIKKRIALLYGNRASVRYLAGNSTLDLSKHRDDSQPTYHTRM